MMRYSLKTLIALLLILPPLGALGWREYVSWWHERELMQQSQLLIEEVERVVVVEEGDGPPEEIKNIPIDERKP